MQEISVSEFRQQCLALMDNLPKDGLLITRNGHPLAKLLPVRPQSCIDLIGSVPCLTLTDWRFLTPLPTTTIAASPVGRSISVLRLAPSSDGISGVLGVLHGNDCWRLSSSWRTSRCNREHGRRVPCRNAIAAFGRGIDCSRRDSTDGRPRKYLHIYPRRTGASSIQSDRISRHLPRNHIASVVCRPSDQGGLRCGSRGRSNDHSV